MDGFHVAIVDGTFVHETIVPTTGPDINVVQWGSQGNRVIVLLHGLRSSALTFNTLAQSLQDNFTVIALDQRGRGKSDWDSEGRYFTQYYVEDLRQVVDALELERFVLLGHSMGGVNAMVFTHLHPHRVEKLIIEDIGPSTQQISVGSTRIQQQLRDTPRVFSDHDSAHAYFRQLRPGASTEAIDTRIDAMLKSDDNTQLTWRFDLDGITKARLSAQHHQQDLWPVVESLTVPTLLIRGAQSDVLGHETYEMMLARNQWIRGVTVDRASHFVHEDNADEFTTVLQRFVFDQS